MKKCSRCKKIKKNSCFAFQNKATNKLMAACKDCMNLWQREQRRLYPELVQARDKKSYQNNKTHRVLYARQYRKLNPEKTKDTNLKMKYGITLEQYNQMLELQGHKCAICGKHQDRYSKALAVDHNHATGKVRALLCAGCNYGVGFLEQYREEYEQYLSFYNS